MTRKPLRLGLLAIALASSATAFAQMHSGGMMGVKGNAKMSKSQMMAMHRCQGMSHRMMMRNHKCMAMMKMHPTMMHSGKM